MTKPTHRAGPGKGPEPPSGFDPAFPVGLVRPWDKILSDGVLLPGVLAVSGVVLPFLPAVQFVLRYIRRDGGDGCHQGG